MLFAKTAQTLWASPVTFDQRKFSFFNFKAFLLQLNEMTLGDFVTYHHRECDLDMFAGVLNSGPQD